MNPYKHLLTKMKYLVNEDRKVPDELKSNFQWSLVFTKDPVKFVIGKGGVNTIFYLIGETREVCYPEDALKLLEKKSLDKYIAYAVYSKEKVLIQGPLLFKEDALLVVPKKGQFLVGVKSNGKLTPLCKAHVNLFNKVSWSSVAKR